MNTTSTTPTPTILTGTVRRFVAKTGFGFIDADDHSVCSDDIFVHQRNIEVEGFRFLTPGDRVKFTLAKTEKGYQAMGVKLQEPRAARQKTTGYTKRRPSDTNRNDGADADLRAQLEAQGAQIAKLTELLTAKASA